MKFETYICLLFFLMPFIAFFIFNIKPNLTSHGKAKWASISDALKMGLFIKKIKDNKKLGFMLGKIDLNNAIAFDKPLACLIVAPPGAGKSQSVAIPNLLTIKQSCVVLDIKGELCDVTAGYRQKALKNKVFIFDPMKSGERNSNDLSFNPFDKKIVDHGFGINENDKIILSEKSSNFDNYDPSINPTLTLDASTNGVIRFDDQISGSSGAVNNTYQMNIGISENFPDNIGITEKQFYELLKIEPGASTTEVVNAFVAYAKQMGQEMTQEDGLMNLVNMGIIETSDSELISSENKGGYNLALTGDDSGTIYLNNSVINAKVSSENIHLNLGKNNVFEQSDFTINSGTLGFINGIAEQQVMKSANINGNINMALDVDLKNEKMDTLPENVVVSKDAQIGVNHLSLLNDATKDETYIQFATDDYKSQVAYTGASPIAYSPIYKYNISYNDETGEFLFLRGAASTGGGGSSSGSYEAFNPAVVAPSVATQAGAYTTQLQTFNYAFQHADTFMNIPYLERVSLINQGRYALSPTGDATDIGTFSPLLTKDSSAGFWVKPYASFENIPLKNGPKVSNINYGTLVGYDTPITSIAHGWERVLTGYIGYNGASQRYTGVDTYQNGGLLGGTITLYKGNFFNATTLSVGASVGDSSNMYGSEDYAMLLAGIGNKTGYNFEFFDGRMILQPSMLISYTFVNTFDYTNSAGLRIESDPLNAIQLAPGIKLIGNTKNGWQPYIGVSMVWNLLQDSRVTANSVRLPEMSIKPYVQYGVGLQKRFTDRFMAYGQAMIHNGGRNGISLSAGLRWKVGKE